MYSLSLELGVGVAIVRIKYLPARPGQGRRARTGGSPTTNRDRASDSVSNAAPLSLLPLADLGSEPLKLADFAALSRRRPGNASWVRDDGWRRCGRS